MRPSAFELRRSELPSADLLCIFRTEGAEEGEEREKKRAIPQRDRVQVGRHLRAQSGYTGPTCVPAQYHCFSCRIQLPAAFSTHNSTKEPVSSDRGSK